MIALGRLEEIDDLRTVWQNEARDFTTWLAEDENINILSDAIGIDITVEKVESSVGDFRADILACETDTDRKIIIENQLADTNHDHLGKIITYASGKDASIIIWLVKRARDEHRAAVEWLNEHTDEMLGFFLCEIKLYKIGDSKPAVKFEVVERPNNWMKEARRPMNETQRRRSEYWSAFIDYAYKNEDFAREFKHVMYKTGDYYLGLSVGNSAVHISLNMVQKNKTLEAELFIHNDKDLFHRLEAHKDKCTINFQWLELPHRKASRIITSTDASFDDDIVKRQEQFDWLINAALEIKKFFTSYS